MDITEELFKIVDSLNAARIPYALCGGFAVALHGYPRVTRDIDLLIEENSLPQVLEEIAVHGFTLPAGIIPLRTGTPLAQRVYHISKAVDQDLLTVDLMLVGDFTRPVWDGRVLFELEGRHISAISRDGLGLMKRSAGRDRDLMDLKELGIPTTNDDES